MLLRTFVFFFIATILLLIFLSPLISYCRAVGARAKNSPADLGSFEQLHRDTGAGLGRQSELHGRPHELPSACRISPLARLARRPYDQALDEAFKEFVEEEGGVK